MDANKGRTPDIFLRKFLITDMLAWPRLGKPRCLSEHGSASIWLVGGSLGQYPSKWNNFINS